MSSTPVTAAPDRTSTRHKFMVLPVIVLILAQMGTTGDNGALSLATSALTRELGATTSDIQLANMIYPLVGGAFMIAGGLMGTILGWKRAFRIGAVLCAAGEVALAVAPNMFVFIWAGRVLVGLGASFLIPSVLGLIPVMYTGRDRMVAFGCIGAASGLSAVLPLMLGVVMEVAGMHVTFFTLAAYFVTVAAASLALPPIAEADEKLRFDGIGVTLAALGLFLFLIGLSSVSSWGLVRPLDGCPFTLFGISPALPMAAAGIVVLAILIKVEGTVEKKNGIALLPRSFLTTPQVLAGLIANAITFFFMGAQSILMAPYLQLVAGWTPVDVGTISIATGVPTFALALGIPKLMPNAHPRRVIQTGYLAMALALGIMALSVTVDGCSRVGVYLGAFMYRRRVQPCGCLPGRLYGRRGRGYGVVACEQRGRTGAARARCGAVRRYSEHDAQRRPGHRRGAARGGAPLWHHELGARPRRRGPGHLAFCCGAPLYCEHQLG